jgi:hypothetical protein
MNWQPLKWPFTLGALIITWLGSASIAHAEIRCDKLPSPREGLRCENTSPAGGTTLTVRHMPAWDANAGLTLIDMCPSDSNPKQDHDQNQGDDSTAKQGEQNQIVVKPIPIQEPPKPRAAPECLRRTCTDVASTFAMTLETPLIPINFTVFVGSTIGFSHARFEVLCKTLPLPGEVRP